MATIRDGSSINQWAIESPSLGGRARLVNANGTPLGKADKAPRVPTDEALPIAGVNDGTTRHIRTDRFGSVATAQNTSLFTELFDGSGVNTARWLVVSTGMAAVQSSSQLLINSGLVTAVTTGYLQRSLRPFTRLQRAPLQNKWRARVVPQLNSVTEFGFGDVSAFNGVHTNGAYFQYTSGGVLQPVLTFNGVDLPGSAFPALNSNLFYTWDILVDDDSVTFTIQLTSTGEIVAERVIALPDTQAKLFSIISLYAFERVYNTAIAPAAAAQLFVSRVDVTVLDWATNQPLKEQMAASGYNAIALPNTSVISSNFINNFVPTNRVTLSNTTVADTALGGLISFSAPVAAATDLLVNSYQNATLRQLVITGLEIELVNTGAAVATTPTTLLWALGVDQLAASLATAGIFRTLIGAQDFQIGAAIGARAQPIVRAFDVPFIINPGRFLTLSARVLVGTATAGQILLASIAYRGYFL